ncbi:MAG: 7-carboxy-7-deazaguanine synthase QueE [Candidatus Omnitrophota bacterium]|jgi:organic radical activating enzyme|nr:MAG: 7-carboxy-7-deazaguanine synthase QueE [Candidatus Omnitrophota bacterium]
MENANIAEIFSSIQGEGPEVGIPYNFIRFTGCNLKCRYCDTDWANEPLESARVLKCSTDIAEHHFNPISLEDCLAIMSGFKHRNWCFTGGEPMLQSQFIEALFPGLKGKRLMMETNGTLRDNITPALVDRIDVWSVDIKLPSVSGESVMEDNRFFLQRLDNAKQVVIKTVFSDETPESELKAALAMADEFKKLNPRMSFVFQPVTHDEKVVTGDNLEVICKIIDKFDFEIRVLPQVHKILRVL